MHWQDYVRTKIDGSTASVEDVKRKIEETADASWLRIDSRSRSIFCVLDYKPPLSAERIKYYSEWAAAHGWVIFNSRQKSLLHSIIYQ